MRGWWLVVVSAACGRVSFDPLGDATTGATDGVDAIDAMTGIGPWSTPVALDIGLTTVDDPTMTADGLEMYVNTLGAQVYATTRATTNDPWQPATLVTTLPGAVYSPHLSADGLTLWAVITSPSHIVVTTRTARTVSWAPVQDIPEVSDPAGDDGVAVTNDGLAMVFDSHRKGVPDPAMYLSTRPTTSSTWSTPVPLSELDAAGGGGRPHLTDDRLSIYFEGAGLNAGEDDVWYAHRATPAAAFDPPQRLTEVNSPMDDEDPWVSADQRVFLVSSVRSGTYLIWQATR
jgi:hypothetical protein